MKQYHVYVYHTVRSKFLIEAESQLEAMKLADELSFADALETEEILETRPGYLVDEVGDEDHLNSHWYD